MSDDPQEDQVPDEEGPPAEEAVSEEESKEKPAVRKAEDADTEDKPSRSRTCGRR